MSDSNGSDEPKLKNKPKDTAFHQQKIKAWTPIVSAKNTSPIFIVLGVIFIPLGIYFLIVSNSVVEYVVDYTHCNTTQGKCSELARADLYNKDFIRCNCTIEIDITQAIPKPVYVFYGLTNFYQNHRRYVKSRDDLQLNGQSQTKLKSDCAPYDYIDNDQTKPIAPCGAIALSLFNDTFKLFDKNRAEVSWSSKNIAWKTDVDVKFGKPANGFGGTYKPISWPVGPAERNADSYSGDEELIVWMRTAALPQFRKLHRIIDADLPAGKYTVDIGYAYPVTQFGGTKRFIMSSMSWLGGKNSTLGIAYIVVGALHFILGLVFVGLHVYLLRRKQRFTAAI